MALRTATSHFTKSTTRSFMTSAPSLSALHFATFDVTSQAFLRRLRVAAIVNLKPIVPGHVLVIPSVVRRRLADLTREEGHDLWDAVREVGSVVEKAYGGQALTVSVQDGPVAGQSVPHVHVHILPRREGDITPNDLIYTHLERFGLSLASAQEAAAMEGMKETQNSGEERNGLKVDADEDRKSRTIQQMQAEARWLTTFFDGTTR